MTIKCDCGYMGKEDSFKTGLLRIYQYNYGDEYEAIEIYICPKWKTVKANV